MRLARIVQREINMTLADALGGLLLGGIAVGAFLTSPTPGEPHRAAASRAPSNPAHLVLPELPPPAFTGLALIGVGLIRFGRRRPSSIPR